MTLHMDGFEQFADDPQHREALLRAGYSSPGNGVGSGGRNGGFCVVVGLDAIGGGGPLRRMHPWISNNFAAGGAIRMSGDYSRGAVLHFKIGSERLVVWTSPEDGWTKLTAVSGDGVTEATGDALPTRNTWYYYELTLSRSEGVARMYINNRFDVEVPMTPAMMNATEIEVTYGSLARSVYRPGPSSGWEDSQRLVDDIYIRDGVRYGPVVVSTRTPTSHKLAQWGYTESEGTPSQVLGTMPPEPLDRFMASETVGAKSTFVSSQNLLSGNKVVATGLVALVRKSPSATVRFRGLIGGDGYAAARSETIAVDSTYRLEYLTFEEVPGDTPNGIKNTQFGIEVAAP